MKNYLVAALVAGGFAAPALAQDNPAFTGFRVEALAGYDSVNLPGAPNPDGFLYGVGLGYDFAAHGLLVGVEADITDSTAKLKLAGPDVVTDRDLYVGARVGKVLGRGAVYAKAGYTNARIEQNGAGSFNADGFRLGAGYEYAVMTNSFVKIEYRYSNYEADVSRNQVVAGFGFRF